jgi:hypothetical protein
MPRWNPRDEGLAHLRCLEDYCWAAATKNGRRVTKLPPMISVREYGYLHSTISAAPAGYLPPEVEGLLRQYRAPRIG